MTHSLRSPKIPPCLSDSLFHRLSVYATAAGGAGTLALAQPAEAKIVYTPAHVVISPYRLHLYNLDLNHDGTTDFVLQSKFYGTTNQSAGTQRLLASGVAGNGLENRGAPLKAGKSIGPNQSFDSRAVLASAFTSAGGRTDLHGRWLNLSNRYLGLKFKINGKTHYGWARLSVQVNTEPFYLWATLTGYAYETIPNKAIVAGRTKGPEEGEKPAPVSLRTPAQPSGTLGSLALGAPGLAIWRRQESGVALEGD